MKEVKPIGKAPLRRLLGGPSMPAWATIHRPLSLERGATTATTPALGAAVASLARAPE